MLLQSERSGDALTLHLSGRWCIENIAQVEASLAEVDAGSQQRVVVDYSGVEMLDLSSAWLLHNRLEKLVAAGGRIEFASEPPAHFQFIDELEQQDEAAQAAPE